jgi:tetratricopeptide (TPR) repeat protein
VAVDYLRQALQLDPGHLAARELLAEILYKVLRRDKDAMAVLQAGAARAPAHTAFTRKLAKILAERGDYAAAARVLLSHGLPNIKADREALEDLAGLYGKLDEPYLAAQTYRYLLAEYPTHGRYWASLGAAQEQQQLPDEAMASYQKALDTGNLGRELADQARGRLDALRRRTR